MSDILLTAFVLLIGAVTYALLKVLIRPVRVVGTCIIVFSLAALIAQNRGTIARQENTSDASPDRRTIDAPSPTGDPGHLSFQIFSKEDHIFLDELLKKQDQDTQQRPVAVEVQNLVKDGLIGSGNESVPKPDMSVKTAKARRPGPVTREKTVKRAQPVTMNETFKPAELVLSRQQ